MNLQHLYYFQTLADELHYHRASEKLYISQPSLTYAIKELEKELNTKLFVKKGKNIQLTNDGKLFLEHVNLSLKILDDGIELLKQKKEVNVSVLSTVVCKFVPFISYLKTKDPDIHIHFHSEKTELILKGLLDDTYDFGICSEINDERFVSIPIMKEDLILIVNKKHPLSIKEKVSIKDISNENLYFYSKSLTLYKIVLDLLKSNDIHINVLGYLDDETSIGAMVNENMGIAIVANNNGLNSYKNIVKIPIQEEYNTREIFITYKQNKKNKIVRDVINEIINYYN